MASRNQPRASQIRRRREPSHASQARRRPNHRCSGRPLDLGRTGPTPAAPPRATTPIRRQRPPPTHREPPRRTPPAKNRRRHELPNPGTTAAAAEKTIQASPPPAPPRLCPAEATGDGEEEGVEGRGRCGRGRWRRRPCRPGEEATRGPFFNRS
jgi:hypothetical protein